ncbi:hypothetical protein BJ742DRAFT_853811 [Cladochytrium replicatum]|nr:hypothetical protein BJ742DRAFT_853811 [Cladochytrium replicatum]
MLAVLFVALAALNVSADVINGTTKIDLFANRKKDFDAFAKYSPEARQFVADSIKKMFGIYVNLDSKLASIGPRADYRKVLDTLVADAKNLSDSEFHNTMSKMFRSLRDLHTNYFFPDPHNCATVFLPVRFELSKTSDPIKDPKPVVFARSIPAITALTPSIADVEFGDVLELYDGKTFVELYELLQDEPGGTNLSGGYRRLVDFLCNRNGRVMPFPSTDSVKLQMARYDDSGTFVKRYTIEVPWLISFSTDVCEKTVASVNGNPIKPPSTDASRESDLEARKEFKNPVMKNEDFETFLSFYPEEAYTIPLTTTGSSILSWTKYRANSCNIGIIRLASFSPQEPFYQTGEFIFLFQSLLVNELADTEGLIIDITNNGGGFVFIADDIPQLFLRRGEFRTGGFKAIVSPENTAYIEKVTGGKGELYQAYQKALANGDKYTEPIPFTSKKETNALGTAYIKPVVVYNNGRCYSACDLFSSYMQDNDLGFVIGEDGETGAGGANVLTLSSSLAPFGFGNIFALGTHQDARVGYRQYVRIFKNAGELIEDRGILADRGNNKLTQRSDSDICFSQHIFNTGFAIRDVRDNLGPLYENLEAIAGFLNTAVHRKGIFESAFLLEPVRNIGVFVINGSSEGARTFDLKIANFDFVRFVDKSTDKAIQDVDLGRVPTVDDPIVKDMKLALPSALLESPGMKRITVQAFRDGVQYVQTHRSVKVFPGPARRLFPYTWDFSLFPLNSAAYIFNFGNEDAVGWKLVNGVLQIGTSPLYTDGVDTTVTFVVTAPPSSSILIGLSGSYQSELNFDFFTVSLTDVATGDDFATLYRVSGSGQFPAEGITSTAYGDKAVFAISLRFTSDSNRIAGFGAKITALKIIFEAGP